MNLSIVIADEDLKLLEEAASREGCNSEAWCTDVLASMLQLIRIEQKIDGALDQIHNLQLQPQGASLYSEPASEEIQEMIRCLYGQEVKL